MARGFLLKRKKKKLTRHIIFSSRYTRTIRKVSHYAEFLSTDTLCYNCNRMSEIHKEPRRCIIHAGGIYA